MKKELLIFVKNPVEGKVKTRLAATVGNTIALDVYNQLMVHTEKCTRATAFHKTVYYGDVITTNDIWRDELYDKNVQQGHDLGERMYNAFDKAFANGMQQVAIIGSDCFEITTEIIEDAFKRLEYNDVVLGPALDGGYYLLAMKVNHPSLFENISWSTNQVLSQTLVQCKKLGLKIAQLPILSDIDTEDDLKRSGYKY